MSDSAPLSPKVHRILIADDLDPSGLERLRAAGAEVVQLAAADRPRLKEILPDFDALVVRSATQVTADVLAAGTRLSVVGRAGVGVDNVDVAAATARGILVVNAPTANLVSATEHAFALLLATARNIPAADTKLKAGVWDRKSFVGVELQGKTLGVVGFGRIGQRVAERARGFEMEIVAYDPFLDAAAAERLGAKLMPLDELLACADAVTIHTPFSEDTKNLFSRERLFAMKKGAILVNCARGGLVDEAALLEALESGHLGGAGLDVFEQEPPQDYALIRHPKVVATPHIGAQTREAQERISAETAEMLLLALAGAMPSAAVNLPFRSIGTRGEPFLRLGERLGSLAVRLLGSAPQRLEVELANYEESLRQPIAIAVLRGVLARFLGGSVNYVNALGLAVERGIEVVRTSTSSSVTDPFQFTVRLASAERTVELGGALDAAGQPRVVRFGGYHLEFRPEGRLLVLENRDVPGVVGKLGTRIGAAGVNIADIHLARRASGEALAVLRLDQNPPPALLEELAALPEVLTVHYVELGLDS